VFQSERKNKVTGSPFDGDELSKNDGVRVNLGCRRIIFQKFFMIFNAGIKDTMQAAVGGGGWYGST